MGANSAQVYLGSPALAQGEFAQGSEASVQLFVSANRDTNPFVPIGIRQVAYKDTVFLELLVDRFQRSSSERTPSFGTVNKISR